MKIGTRQEVREGFRAPVRTEAGKILWDAAVHLSDTNPGAAMQIYGNRSIREAIRILEACKTLVNLTDKDLPL